MAALVLVNGNPPGQVVELEGDEFVIGRLPQCEVVLEPNGVSRRHAKLLRRGAGFVLVDLGSRNRTKLNEHFIAPEQEHPLATGDRISICDVEMVYYAVFNHPNLLGGNGDLVVTDGEDTTVHTIDAARSDILASAVRPEVKLRAILEIGRSLASTLKVEDLAPKLLESLLELFTQAERGFLVLLKADEPGKKWSIRQTYHKLRPPKKTSSTRLGVVPADEARMSISRSIITHVLGQKKAVVSQDAGNDANLPTSASIADLKIRSVMCAPLLTPEGQALGILQLDTSDRRQFGQDDLELLLSVAGQAAIAIDNAQLHEGLIAQDRISRDLSIAQTIQARFLPRKLPEHHGYEFFAHYHAAYSIGGDYYDFVELPERRLAIVLGDVAGKGVAAALMMAKYSGDTRTCVHVEGGPAAAAGRLNGLLCAADIDDRFITLSLGLLDLNSRRLTLTSAGHLPVMIRRVNGRVDSIGAEIAGFPLGIEPGTTYKEVGVVLDPGDVVVVISDGVTDARNPAEEPYDTQASPRLVRRIADTPGGPSAVGRAILQDLREFSAGHSQVDDITLVCFGPTPN